MPRRRHSGPRGFTVVELLVVMGIVSFLLTTGYLLHRNVRRAARRTLAENRLKQVAACLELYFHKHRRYPPQASDLVGELASFAGSLDIFTNPLREEEVPGEDLNAFYQYRTLEELDGVGTYIACFPPEDPSEPIVVLETGGRITHKKTPGFSAEHYQLSSLLAVLYPQPDVVGDGPSDTAGDDGGVTDDPPLPPDEPGSGGSPDDHTEENPDGAITTKDCCDATFEVRAARLTWGPDGPDVPITVSASFAGSGTRVLFGGEPVTGGATETVTSRKRQSSAISCHAEYGPWAVTYSSDGDPHQVLSLRNGDAPVEFDPHQNATPVGPDLEGLLDPSTGVVTIEDNQVLYLVELGSTSSASRHFDFQDLIILATYDPPSNPAECVYPEEVDDGFYVGSGGDVVTKRCSDLTITCVGSQFGYADGTLVPIRASAALGGDPWLHLYGGTPVSGGEQHQETSVAPGTAVRLQGEIVGEYERWLWQQYGYPTSYASDDGSGQVLVYRKGDSPPDFAPGFPCQTSAGDLLASYIDPQIGVVTIADNELLFLWDFNPRWTHSGLDYQDLIMLATATAAASECDGGAERTAASSTP